MKCTVQKSLSAAALLFVSLYTSYAHAAPMYVCSFEKASPQARYELRVREQEDEGKFTYTFSSADAPTPISGSFPVYKTGATWSHFVYTGSDSAASIKLSVPAGLNDNSVYLQMEIQSGELTLDAVQYLQCNRAR